MNSVAGPDCFPHPVEAGKVERIKRESELKGTDPADNPGWRGWLCRPCGTWHRNLNLENT